MNSNQRANKLLFSTIVEKCLQEGLEPKILKDILEEETERFFEDSSEDPVIARARTILALAGIPYGQEVEFPPLCPHKRTPVDCDTCAILGYIEGAP